MVITRVEESEDGTGTSFLTDANAVEDETCLANISSNDDSSVVHASVNSNI